MRLDRSCATSGISLQDLDSAGDLRTIVPSLFTSQVVVARAVKLLTE